MVTYYGDFSIGTQISYPKRYYKDGTPFSQHLHQVIRLDNSTGHTQAPVKKHAADTDCYLNCFRRQSTRSTRDLSQMESHLQRFQNPLSKNRLNPFNLFAQLSNRFIIFSQYLVFYRCSVWNIVRSLSANPLHQHDAHEKV